MKQKTSNTNSKNKFEQRINSWQTIEVFTTIVLVGISMLFIGLLSAYLFAKQQWTWQQFPFPKLFLISTLVLGLSSLSMSLVIKFYKKDNLPAFKRATYATLLLGIAFLVFQVLAWFQLNNSGIFLAGKPDGSYLYLISGLHALHLLAGLGLLIHLAIFATVQLSEPVKQLLYFTDSYKLTKLKLIAIYWHYVDILWVLLLIFFLFNHL